MELRPPTRDLPFSKHNDVKLSNLHIAVTSFAAIAGVAIAGYQAFGPHFGGQPPLNVVAVDSLKAAANLVVEKSDAIPAMATQSLELGRDAVISAALKDGSEKRYTFTDLFDGRSDTYLTIYAVVGRIPEGSVATYGQVASLAGLPGRARLVGVRPERPCGQVNHPLASGRECPRPHQSPLLR